MADDTKKRTAPQPLLKSPLAYKNSAFLNGPDGRALRFLAEYSEPLARFRREKIQDTVVFFGSARFKNQERTGRALQFLEKTGSVAIAPPHEQPNGMEQRTSEDEEIQSITGVDSHGELSLKMKRVKAAVEMSRYYEDARALAKMHTEWAMSLPFKRHRFVVTSGGGPGIMEAANLGAYEARGKTIGLNIQLPFEQMPNPYISPELNFEFHYFFMRKYWFAYLAKALVVFPGGFGTFDEMFELLTLAQTGKLAKKIIVILYGSEFWNKVINFQALADWGTISPADLDLFHFADTPQEAFNIMKSELTKYHLQPQRPEKGDAPEIARTLP